MGSTASPCPPVVTTPSPTSAKPRVSTSVTQCTTSAGTSGGVGGAKSARTPWGGQGEGRAVLDPHSPSPQPYIMPQPTGTLCRPHLAGPGVLASPGSAGPGAARAALGVQQQLAAPALQGSLPKTEAGAAGTAGLGADDLAGGNFVSTPLHPSCVPRGQRWGGGTHRFGGELVLGLQEAGWRGGEGGRCWLSPRAALGVAVLPRGTATRILTGTPRRGRLCRERRQWRGPHRQGATVPPRWEQTSPSNFLPPP